MDESIEVITKAITAAFELAEDIFEDPDKEDVMDIASMIIAYHERKTK